MKRRSWAIRVGVHVFLIVFLVVGGGCDDDEDSSADDDDTSSNGDDDTSSGEDDDDDSGGDDPPPADWVIFNGFVYTVDAERNVASAVVVRDGLIVYVGDDQTAKRYIGQATTSLDLQGRMLLPGFFDSHNHPPGTSLTRLYEVVLFDKQTLAEYQQAVATFRAAHPAGEVVNGYGWENGVFEDEPRGPRKEDLDAVVADVPVALTSVDGHSLWVNSTALEMAHITSLTPDPPGGTIERTDDGEPWGVLRESAMILALLFLPPEAFTQAQYNRALKEYQEEMNSYGITSIHLIMENDDRIVASFQQLLRDGTLSLRCHFAEMIWPIGSIEPIMKRLGKLESEYGGPQLRFNILKLMMDGVVEGATAFLEEPYAPGAGKPEWYRGLFLWPVKHLHEVCAQADQAGFQLHFHSIGDGATRRVLDALDYAAEQNGLLGNRHILTHLQLVRPVDIERMSRLGVVAAIQPFWHYKDPYYYGPLEAPYLGEDRASQEYPLASFFNAGLTVASASDCPVTYVPNPLEGIEIGVTRNAPWAADMDDPKTLLNASERATLDQMIASFTIEGARANFREEELGSLEVNKRADLVVIDRNLFEIPTVEIAETKVLLTMFDGREVFRAEDFQP